MPRHRPHRYRAAFGFGAFGAAVAMVASALAQTPATPDLGTFNPPSSGVLDPDAPSESPSLIRKNVPAFTAPPASGAGKTGFDSTNARRKIQSAIDKKKERRPLPPAVTARVAPAQPLPAAPALPPLQPVDPVTTGSIRRDTPPAPPRPKPKQPEVDPYEPLGIRAGSFILRPAIELTGGYDSNPRRESAPEGSSLYIIAPEVKAKSDWDRHEVRASVRGKYTGYGQFSSLNSPYFESVLDGRLDVSSQTRVELQSRFKADTDTPGTPNFQADAAKQTIFTNVGGTAGIVHRFNRLEIGGKAGIDRTRYQDSKLTDGTTADNADRDYSSFALELRGSYEAAPGIKPFLAVTTDHRMYDISVDRFGVQRDSRGLTPRIGTSFELTRLLTGDVSVGYVTRKYEDPQLRDLQGVVADASLVWSATPLTKFTFTAKSSVSESTDPEISGILERDFAVRIDHSLREWLIASLKLGYGLDDYVGSSRADQRFSGSAGLTYKMNRNVQLKGEYRREQRSSNIDGNGYAANIVLFGLRLQQ